MTAVDRDYIAYLCVGLILGAVGYIVVGALFLLNFAAQNALAAR